MSRPCCIVHSTSLNFHVLRQNGADSATCVNVLPCMSTNWYLLRFGERLPCVSLLVDVLLRLQRLTQHTSDLLTLTINTRKCVILSLASWPQHISKRPAAGVTVQATGGQRMAALCRAQGRRVFVSFTEAPASPRTWRRRRRAARGSPLRRSTL